MMAGLRGLSQALMMEGGEQGGAKKAPRTIADVLTGAKPGRETMGRTQQFEKAGAFGKPIMTSTASDRLRSGSCQEVEGLAYSVMGKERSSVLGAARGLQRSRSR